MVVGAGQSVGSKQTVQVAIIWGIGRGSRTQKAQ